MAEKTKRARKHPGVILIPPEPKRRTGWRARWRDPDAPPEKPRFIKVTLDKAAGRPLTKAGQREAWAIAKSKELAKRRVELEGGAVRASGTKLADAVAEYFKANARLSERSQRDYKIVGKKLCAWATLAGVRTCDDLTRGKLHAFRQSLVTAPRTTVKRGQAVGRGTREVTAELRAPETVNGQLRKTRSILSYMRQMEWLPWISSDDLRDALKKLPVVRERLHYLPPAECQKLLDAALRHDDAERGRFEPIAPFTAFVLLTGMRAGEALGLTWSCVHLDATDHEGQPVGEIRLEGRNVKTRRARTVGLEVSPMLRTLLVALKLRSGGEGSVFGLTDGMAESASLRLRGTYGAPAGATWQSLRRTCGTFLTNAPGIFGAASAYRSAAQLGHSVQTAMTHYISLERGIPREARVLEAAMQIEPQLKRVLAAAGRAGVGADVVALHEAPLALVERA